MPCHTLARETARRLWKLSRPGQGFRPGSVTLSRLMPDRTESGEVGAAAQLRLNPLPDPPGLETVRLAKNYLFDKIIGTLGSDATPKVTEWGKTGAKILMAQHQSVHRQA